MRFRSCFVALFAASVLTCAASAQWSASAAANLKLSANSGEQNSPKIVPTSDGGAWVTWYDNTNGGYDVTIQRLDVCGGPQLDPNGIRLSDRAISSTVDYDLIVDSAGRAVCAYNDDFGGGSGAAQQIVVHLIDSDGTSVWGGGVTVSSGTLGKVNPHVCELSTGEYVVGWSESVTGGAQQFLLRLIGADGTPKGPAVAFPETSRFRTLLDLHSGLNGRVIAYFIRGSGTSQQTSSRQLWTQKYDVVYNAGTDTTTFTGRWPSVAAPVPLVVTGATTSTGNGYTPTCLSDGAGGAVFGWYEGGGPRNAYLQHVLSDGTFKFGGATSVPIASAVTAASRIRVGASHAYDPVSGNYFMGCVEVNASPQTDYRVFAQKFSAVDGSRQWGDLGFTLIPQGTPNQPSFVTCTLDGSTDDTGVGCFVASIDSRTITTGIIQASHVLGDASVAFANQVVSSTIETKTRLSGAVNSNGFLMLAFGGGGTTGGPDLDLQAQNVNPDGSLGTGLTVVVNPPANVSASAGDQVVLSAGVGGMPGALHQWKRIVAGTPVALSNGPTGNGSTISGAQSPNLVIASAQPADSGSYRLDAFNACGASVSTSVAIVTVTGSGGCNLADITEVGGTAEAPGNPDNQLTVDDVIVFVNLFSDGTGCPGAAPCSRADVCGVGGPPELPEGELTVDDVIGFFNAFSDGC